MSTRAEWTPSDEGMKRGARAAAHEPGARPARAAEAPVEAPQALQIAAGVGAPSGTESVYQYVDESARAIQPGEEASESALALTLLLVGQLGKLHDSKVPPDNSSYKTFVTTTTQQQKQKTTRVVGGTEFKEA